MGIKPRATIYTDGSCLRNPGPGGWAAVITVDDTTLCVSGGAANTTNNRMELTAVIFGLLMLTKCSYDVSIYSDSQYVIHAFDRDWISSWMRNGWSRSGGELKNSDLWAVLADLAAKHTCTWRWVKGHADDETNNYTDQLAVSRSRGIDKEKDDGSVRVTTLDGKAFPLSQGRLQSIHQKFISLCEGGTAETTPDVTGQDMPYAAAGNTYTGGPAEAEDQVIFPEDTLFDPAPDVTPDMVDDDVPAPAEEYEAPQDMPGELPDDDADDDEHGERPAAIGDSAPGHYTMPNIVLSSSEQFMMQMLMEMNSANETGLLRPCGNYVWCEACENANSPLSCIEAFSKYRCLDIP